MKISVIASGSNGNCCLVEHNNTSLLIDAGKSGRVIEKRMNNLGKSMENVDAILITHAHSDHIQGAGVLSRRYNLPLYMSKQGFNKSKYFLGKVSEKTFDIVERFRINDMQIDPIKTSHSDDSCGFVINDFGYFTDTGCITLQMANILPKLNGILLESNHDISMVEQGPYPYYLKQRILSDEGHLSNEHASYAIQNLCNGVKLALLGHLSGTNNTEELALETFRSIVKKETEVAVCSRSKESGTWEL